MPDNIVHNYFLNFLKVAKVFLRLFLPSPWNTIRILLPHTSELIGLYSIIFG